MANTTNFGWETPDDTDLVKDGAAAMRTLGNSIDASFVDLKGGTSGQILSKNSNTDLDFVWIANDQGDITAVTAGTGLTGGGTTGAVTLTNDMATTITAAGDIVVGTGSGTYDNLPIGTTGQVLTADTTVSPYKVKWAAASAGGINPNAVVNGGFDIWQRGTSFTALSKTFTADRWWKFRGGDATGGTWSRQNSATSAPGTQYCMRIQRDSGNTSTATMQLYSDFETSNSIIYAGQEITVSFYARKGANYSGGDFNVTLQTGTGTDQSQFAGFTNETTVLTVTATAASMNTSTFVRYSGTVTLATTVTQLGLKAIWTPTGTAGAADYVEITGIKLEEGSSATDFIRSGGTLSGEHSACERYYKRWTRISPIL